MWKFSAVFKPLLLPAAILLVAGILVAGSGWQAVAARGQSGTGAQLSPRQPDRNRPRGGGGRGRGQTIKLTSSNEIPRLTEIEAARREREMEQMHPPVPFPVQSSIHKSAKRSTNPPMFPPTGAPRELTALSSPAAPNDFAVTVNRAISSNEVPVSERSISHWPQAISAGANSFFVANWYAALSTNGGSSYQYINPSTNFPSVNGGFCCDQSVAYAPDYGRTFWLLNYGKDATANTLRIAQATDSQLAANVWTYYDFKSPDFNYAGHYLAYARMTVGKTWLYVTANVFKISDNSFAGAIIFRLSLSELAAGNFIWYYYTLSGAGGNWSCAEGAHEEMVFTNFVASDRLRVYRWPDNSIGIQDIAITDVPLNYSYVFGSDAVARCPDGNNFAQNLYPGIMAAWLVNGKLSLMWHAKENTAIGRPYPYTIMAELDAATFSVLGYRDIWNPNFSWLYPNVAVSPSGDVGVMLAYGGGTFYPTTSIFVLDSVNSDINTGPSQGLSVAVSNAGPANAGWVSLQAVKPSKNEPNTFVAAVYALSGGGAGTNVVPYYLRYGRERNFTYCGLSAITLGQTINGVLSTSDCLAVGRVTSDRGVPYADRYSFNGSTGQRIVITMTGDFDTYLNLIGPSGAVIYSDDDGGVEQNSRIPTGSGAFTLPASGTYIIEATAFSVSGVGTYALSLTGDCAYSISSTTATVGAAGGTGSVSVTALSGCAWSATSNAPWITITAGASGNGNGAVSYSVAVNTGTALRTGTMSIAGQTFTVTQPGANSVPTLDSLNPRSASRGGAAFTLTVNGAGFVSGAAVRWNGSTRTTAFVSSTQLTAQIPASDLTTAGTAQVTVFNPAPGGGLSNSLTFTINLSCSYSLNLTSQSFTPSAGTGSVAVAAGSGCTWTASSNAAWITITSGGSGNGNGTVNYSVAANTGAARSGTMTIAGQTFTVSQSCTGTFIAAQPANQTVCAGAGASFSVSATGAGTLGFQWQKNGVNIAGATNSSYSIPVAAAGDAGAYTVVVTGACDSRTSNVATLILNTPPLVTAQPATQNASPGSSATFTAAASGSPAPTVQWQVSTDGVNYSNVSGAISTMLTVSNVTLGQNGNRYRAVFTNPCNTATTNPATLTVNCPMVTVSPDSLPSGSTSLAYSQTLTASGGVAAYRFSISAGVLPAGLSLSTAGLLSGTPTQGGTFNFTVAATDANNCFGSRAYTLTIGCTFDITPKSQSFTASGGADNVNVTAGNSCGWAATSNATWIAINGGASGSGNGTVNYSVALNPTTNQRTGTLIIAGLIFTVTQAGGTPNPIPVVSSLSPASVTAGGGGFTLTVNGSSFINGAVVRVNESDRQTSFVSATRLTAQILATDIVAAGSARIIVVNPAPGGGSSALTNLTITPPVLGYTISGKITYADQSSRTVPGVIVTASVPGSPDLSSLPSGSDGQYAITGVATGNYHLTPMRPGGINGLNGVNGITAFDAARIMQRLAANDPFVGIQGKAADVDGDGLVNANDAARIANFVVGREDQGDVGKWAFDPASDILHVSGNMTFNFRSVLMGDISLSWRPLASLAISGVEPVTLRLKNEATGNLLDLPGLVVNGYGFAPGTALVATFPDGGEMKLSGPQIISTSPESLTVAFAPGIPGLWTFRVVHADGHTSDAFVVRVE